MYNSTYRLRIRSFMVIVHSFLLFLIIVIEVNIVADRNSLEKKCVMKRFDIFDVYEEEHKHYTERFRRFPLVIQTHMVHKCDNAPTSLYHTTYCRLSDAKLMIFSFWSADVTATAPKRDDIQNGFRDFISNVKSLLTILYVDCNF